MRGGTANCTVIIADEEIGSPTVRNPGTLLAFNQPSMDKYELLIKSGGLIRLIFLMTGFSGSYVLNIIATKQ